MYGYIYKTIDKSNGKIYVVQHKSSEFDESYFGSGKIIKNKILSKGKENFDCYVLQECDSLEELNEAEIFWIKELDALNSDVGYNIATGGAFGDSGYHQGMLGKHQSEKQKEAIRNYMKTKVYSEEERHKMSISKVGNTNAAGNKGYIHIYKDDQEIKIKPNELETYLELGWQKGHKPYSEEYIKERKDSYKNGCYITKDGVIKHILNTDLQKYLDLGWKIGKGSPSDNTRQKISDAQKGRICITNGFVNKYISPDDWTNYEKLGWFKMCKQKYKKLFVNETPRELLETPIIGTISSQAPIIGEGSTTIESIANEKDIGE